MRSMIDSRLTQGYMKPGSEPAPVQAAPLFACILVTPYGVPAPERLELAEALRARCARVADRVAWLCPDGQDWPHAVLLALGRCSVSEAQAICERLLTWTTARQLTAARCGIGPTQTLAQFAAQRAASGVVRAIEPEQAHAFLQRLPVESLSGLATAAITHELVARLQRYGLRTLDQVAQLAARDPQALRRQFGATAGEQLAILAQGHDLYLLQATPARERLSLRLRFASGVTPDQALAALPRLAARLAERLAISGKRGRRLQLRIVWESGSVMRARRRLARPFCQPSELAQTAQALLTTLLTHANATEAEAMADMGASRALVVSLSVNLSDLSPQPLAQQAALFPTPRPRSAHLEDAQGPLERIAREVAEPLARRYGTPALYRLTTPQPDAILPEERAQLVSLTAAQSDHQRQLPAAARAPGRERAVRAPGDDAEGGARPPQPHWW